ncbi:hypothetical protein PR202_gb12030 [Eleusine coracana subsp. coracana]|uniref:RRM domain-containing protein n=1 Tax=Eleusine coracana subsp. coracana TaxID=191504 RepID=A0AAV5ENX5_ELECO|nr:hypothetical protein PR202_gb12030 [Eleusine coracana subsp. coracana]
MAPPPPLSWADAPPYHYHGTPLPLPKTVPPEEATGGGGRGGAGGPDEARSLWIGGLLPWMNEDYLYSCFTRVPEVFHFASSPKLLLPFTLVLCHPAGVLNLTRLYIDFTHVMQISTLLTWIQTGDCSPLLNYSILLFYHESNAILNNPFFWMQLVSIVVRRNKHTGQSTGFGFLNFADHSTADHVLQSYNGQKMPNAKRDFRLKWHTHAQQPSDNQHFKINWGTQQQDPPQRHTDENSDHVIFVGDLAFDVTAFMLQHLFKSRYYSVKSAKVIYDISGRSKGYGFVSFGDANECRQAMIEMNGAYYSTRPMRIGPVPGKKVRPHGTQGIDFYIQDPNNSRLFVSSLGESVTSEDLKQAFAPCGEIVNVKVLEGKNSGFVTYSNSLVLGMVMDFCFYFLRRASAEEAIRMLNESQLGGSTIKVLFARPRTNKQDQLNIGHHGRPQPYGPGLGWSPQDPSACSQTGHPGNGSFLQLQQPQVQVT